jgi:hypothetical protein
MANLTILRIDCVEIVFILTASTRKNIEISVVIIHTVPPSRFYLPHERYVTPFELSDLIILINRSQIEGVEVVKKFIFFIAPSKQVKSITNQAGSMKSTSPGCERSRLEFHLSPAQCVNIINPQIS